MVSVRRRHPAILVGGRKLFQAPPFVGVSALRPQATHVACNWPKAAPLGPPQAARAMEESEAEGRWGDGGPRVSAEDALSRNLPR